MAKNLYTDELEKTLEILLEHLEKKGMLKGLSADQKKQLVADTIQLLDQQGVEITHDNLKSPDIIKTLSLLLVTTSVNNDPTFTAKFGKLPLNLKLLFPKERLTEAEQLDLLEQKQAVANQLKLVERALNFQLKKDGFKPSTAKEDKPNPAEELLFVAVYDSGGNIIDIKEGCFAPASKAADSLAAILLRAGEEPEEKELKEKGIIQEKNDAIGCGLYEKMIEGLADAGLTTLSRSPLHTNLAPPHNNG